VQEEAYNDAFIEELEKIAKKDKYQDVSFGQGSKGVLKATMGSPGEFGRYVGKMYGNSAIYGIPSAAAGAAAGAGGAAIAKKLLKRLKGSKVVKPAALIGGLAGLYGGGTVGSEIGIRKHLKERGIERKGILWTKYKVTSEAMKKYKLKPKKD